MGDEPSTSKDADDTQVETQPWTRYLKLLPPFTYNKLQKHLGLDSQQNSTGTKKDEKLGYRLFKEGYVSNVQAKSNIPNSASGKSFILKATVHASMKKLSYVVYVHLNQVNGDVVHGHCSCKAGKGGQCKHVAAMLYQIIDYVQLEVSEVPDVLTCTQVLQQWNVPSRQGSNSNNTILFEDIAFKKSSYAKDSNLKRKCSNERDVDFNPTPPNGAVSQNDIHKLVDSLQCKGKAEYLSNILQSNNFQPVLFEEMHSKLPSKKCRTEQAPCNLNDYHVRDQTLEHLQHKKINLANVPGEIAAQAASLEVTHDQFLEIERNTRGQASSDRWYNERKHRITASNFGLVIKRRKSIYPKSIIKTLTNSTNSASCPMPCRWGKQNETEALKQYVSHKQNSVNVCSLCGFVVDKTSPWLGASPDFLIHDSSEVGEPSSALGLGEIKCPYSKRENTIDEACDDNNFFLSKVDGKVLLKRNHSYYYQVQGCLATLELKWSDFVVFTKKDLHIERIYFDKELWEKTMLPQLSEFYFEYLFQK